MSRYSSRFVLALLLTFVVLPRLAVAIPFVHKNDYIEFKDPDGRFRLEYPKDWQPTIVGSDVLFTFVQKDGEAALVIERFQLDVNPADIKDLFGELETDALKKRQPQATAVSSTVVADVDARPVAIDYSRQGLAGPERGRQYSFLVGKDVYRLNFTARMSWFIAKYEQKFLYMAQSFKPASAAAPAAGQPAAK